jgi:hypothetical protein
MLGWVFLAALAAVLVGCDVSGVTRDPSVARLKNDLRVPVQLRLCSSDDCADGFHPPKETLSPGDTWSVNVSSVGVPNVYLVQTGDGNRFGCLPLVSPKLKHERITVLVSEYVPCRDRLKEDAFWPVRWERMD